MTLSIVCTYSRFPSDISRVVWHGFAELKGEEVSKPDGLKLDVNGNIFSTGPGGIWACTQEGDILGRIKIPERTTNLAWGKQITATCILPPVPAFTRYNVQHQAHIDLYRLWQYGTQAHCSVV